MSQSSKTATTDAAEQADQTNQILTPESTDETALGDPAESSTPRLRFSIQSIAWLTLVVAILCAWYMDRSALQRQIIQAKSGNSWSIHQVLGPPNTSRMGDVPTAWASSLQDAPVEWIDLRYETSQPIQEIIVHETYNPGALSKVTYYDRKNKEVVAWKGTDPFKMENGVAVARIKLAPTITTNRIRIYLDSGKVPGWNEIDAVGLVDTTGTTHWAAQAKASSVYSGLPSTLD